VPKRLADKMSHALATLARVVRAGSRREAPPAALDVARASLDLQLRYRPPVEIDLARLELWTRELQADAAAGDRAEALGDVMTLAWIRDRIDLGRSDAVRIDGLLRSLRAAAEAGELTVAANAAARLRSRTR